MSNIGAAKKTITYATYGTVCTANLIARQTDKGSANNILLVDPSSVQATNILNSTFFRASQC
jgi:hypothetical protein